MTGVEEPKNRITDKSLVWKNIQTRKHSSDRGGVQGYVCLGIVQGGVCMGGCVSRGGVCVSGRGVCTPLDPEAHPRPRRTSRTQRHAHTQRNTPNQEAHPQTKRQTPSTPHL